MKQVVSIFFLILLISNLFAWRDSEMEVRVFYDNQSQLEQLQNFKFEGDIYPNGEAIVYVVQSELDQIINSGLHYQIEKGDMQYFAANFWQSQDNSREAYHTVSEIITLADSLVGAFPDICQKVVYGTSMGGTELAALRISDNAGVDENEAEIMFDAGIHGDEIGGPENVIRFARDICLDYGVDPDITDLIDNREIWLYYMVNPDGRSAMSRYNNNGVDLNRDASYMWDAWGGSSGPASQIESKSLRDITFERNFVVHTTYHSGIESISCPWSYRSSQCPDYDNIIQLAGNYSTTSGYANIPYYQGNTGMYAINGSTKDTNYGAMGSISWSMEISLNKQPPSSQIMMYYNYNKPAMLSMIEHAGYGLEGVVTDATNGQPVTANVFINDYFPCYTDANAGDFHKYVLTGTYDITVVANGYETQTITGVTVAANNSTSTDFQLQPLDGNYVYKIRSSRIPDNNSADEGDTPGVIGAPDDRNYSIGKDGWVVLDMQFPIPDGAGNDLIVYEGDTTPESYTVFAGETVDGPWITVGTGTGTTEIDLANGGVIEAQFIRILDDGDGAANAANAGFDLDAVEAIAEVAGVYIAFLGFELDEMIGNNNGYIDPGETMDMLVSLRNNGSVLAEDVEGILSTTSVNVTMNNGEVSFGDIEIGAETFGIFTFTVDVATPIGELLAFDFEVTANAGSYTTNFDIACMVGIAIEDFESNSFNSFEWEFGGNLDWTISSEAYEGSFSAKSGDIGDSQDTSLMVTAEIVAAGDLSFFRKVSSESGWDFLNFYIDNTQLGNWSGSSDWVQENYPVTAGTHTFKWEYTKDTNTSSGSDCGWIDYIIFPPMNSGYVQLNPPTNLQAELLNYNEAELTWDAPAIDNSISKEKKNQENSRDLLGYNVYENAVFVEMVSDLTYYINGLDEGDYSYCITAVYDEGESNQSNYDIVDVILPAPENLTAETVALDVVLNWDVPQRDLTEYKIYRDGTEIGTTTDLTYTDVNVPAGDYTYGVTAVFSGGFESDVTEVSISHTDAGNNMIPVHTELTQIYPNPFNPQTTISFSLSQDAKVSISVFNVKGQRINSLVNDELAAGFHQVVWKGIEDSGKHSSSGIYFVIMDARNGGLDFTSVKKIILLK
jgi:Zinc carboxypeptidase/Carboxypeptidase regulatory-like domain/FlgD Ig-like domain